MERKELLTIVLIGVLLVTVAIQTVQLVTLSGTPVVATSTGSSMVKTPVAAGSTGGASSLDNLPSMVGGC